MAEIDTRDQLATLLKEIRAQTTKIEAISACLDRVAAKPVTNSKAVTALDASSPTPTTPMVSRVDIHDVVPSSTGCSSVTVDCTEWLIPELPARCSMSVLVHDIGRIPAAATPLCLGREATPSMCTPLSPVCPLAAVLQSDKRAPTKGSVLGIGANTFDRKSLGTCVFDHKSLGTDAFHDNISSAPVSLEIPPFVWLCPCAVLKFDTLAHTICSTECFDRGVIDITEHMVNHHLLDKGEDQRPSWSPPPLILPYVMSELQDDKIQRQPWPPPKLMYVRSTLVVAAAMILNNEVTSVLGTIEWEEDIWSGLISRATRPLKLGCSPWFSGENALQVEESGNGARGSLTMEEKEVCILWSLHNIHSYNTSAQQSSSVTTNTEVVCYYQVPLGMAVLDMQQLWWFDISVFRDYNTLGAEHISAELFPLLRRHVTELLQILRNLSPFPDYELVNKLGNSSMVRYCDVVPLRFKEVSSKMRVPYIEPRENPLNAISTVITSLVEYKLVLLIYKASMRDGYATPMLEPGLFTRYTCKCSLKLTLGRSKPVGCFERGPYQLLRGHLGILSSGISIDYAENFPQLIDSATSGFRCGCNLRILWSALNMCKNAEQYQDLTKILGLINDLLGECFPTSPLDVMLGRGKLVCSPGQGLFLPWQGHLRPLSSWIPVDYGENIPKLIGSGATGLKYGTDLHQNGTTIQWIFLGTNRYLKVRASLFGYVLRGILVATFFMFLLMAA